MIQCDEIGAHFVRWQQIPIEFFHGFVDLTALLFKLHGILAKFCSWSSKHHNLMFPTHRVLYNRSQNRIGDYLKESIAGTGESKQIMILNSWGKISGMSLSALWHEKCTYLCEWKDAHNRKDKGRDELAQTGAKKCLIQFIDAAKKYISLRFSKFSMKYNIIFFFTHRIPIAVR